MIMVAIVLVYRVNVLMAINSSMIKLCYTI